MGRGEGGTRGTVDATTRESHDILHGWCENAIRTRNLVNDVPCLSDNSNGKIRMQLSTAELRVRRNGAISSSVKLPASEDLLTHMRGRL